MTIVDLFFKAISYSWFLTIIATWAFLELTGAIFLLTDVITFLNESEALLFVRASFITVISCFIPKNLRS